MAEWTVRADYQLDRERAVMRSLRETKSKVAYLMNRASAMATHAQAPRTYFIDGTIESRDKVLSSLHEAEDATESAAAEKRVLAVMVRCVFTRFGLFWLVLARVLPSYLEGPGAAHRMT